MQMTMVILGILKEEEDEVQDSSSVTHNFVDDEALDVAALAAVTAAENLLQLSGEGRHESSHKKRKARGCRERGGCDSSDRSITSRVIMEEIFGKGGGGDRSEDGQEADEVESGMRVGPSSKRRKRKFRSLENLYEVTKPLKTR